MFRRRWSAWWPAIAWTVLLALLPWWLGLPLLASLAAALLVRAERLGAHAGTIRRGLRWGLPGLLLALLQALGGDARAWVLTLLAALAGFSLLMLLESWLDRDVRRVPVSPSSTAEWSELAQAPIGPAAAIIELLPPTWLSADSVRDSHDGAPTYADHAFRLADGACINGVDPRCCYGPDGRWFVAALAAGRGLALRDCRRGRLYRLRGWQLYGWQGGMPWLSRSEDSAPLTLAHVLGRDDESA